MNIMKKKTYIIPCINVMHVNIQPLLYTSTLNPEDDPNPGVIVTNGEYHETFSSRGGNTWDDDE